MADFTHFTQDGRPQMVNVAQKAETQRIAIATGQLRASSDVLSAITSGGVKKGDVLSVAQLAGIMAAKKTSDLIPLCHPLGLSHIDVALQINDADSAIDIRAECRLTGQTGVEMEALTAVSIAALTIYDMCKSIDKKMWITDIKLIHKSGGKSGEFNLKMTDLKAVADAQNAIFSMMAQAKTEMRPLHQAASRILAVDIAAKTDHPAAAISAMDGYALFSGGTTIAKGSVFDIIGEAAAGHLSAPSITKAQAVRIFTGAYLPQGADSIALQEDVTRDGSKITLEESVKAGQFVRPKGLDFNLGETLLKAGTLLGARSLALASLAGHSTLPVRQKPVIAILSSGDELVEAGTPPEAGQLVNSNSVFLTHALAEAGAEVIDLGIIPDKKSALITTLEEGLSTYGHFDLIICTGGASVGNHDHIAADLMADKASEIDFWRIAMRPGKPLIAASWHNIPFLGLPGNPVSAGVCSLIFVLPAIRSFLQLPSLPPPRHLPLAEDMPENDQRQDYIRAIFVQSDTGELTVKPLGKQDSSMLRNFCHADTLILRPPFSKACRIGDLVEVVDIPANL